MSLLPVTVQPPRARTDVSNNTPDRQASDNAGTFATSLASARADDTRASSAEYAANKARLASQQQRAHVQSALLNGAMRFAATRNDAPAVTQVPADVVASQPASELSGASVEDANVPAVTAACVAPTLNAASTTAPVAGETSESAPPVAVALDVSAAQSMPDLVSASVEEQAATTDVVPMVDSAMTNAATAAAMQLVATLPLVAAQVELADAPENAAEPKTVSTSNSADVALGADVMDAAARTSVASGLAASASAATVASNDATALVEDHFDAPASAAGAPQADVSGAAAQPATDSTTSNAAAATPSASTTAGGAPASTASTGSAPTKPTTTMRNADAASVERDVARLDPEFRDRLERVMDRMRQEFGHTVAIVETVRSQARQDALFAQGRTAPGPVVTWTKNSKHGKGLAADLVVDGQWQNPAGYARLAELAKQEGLRTLGARDPGHVELPVEGGVSGETLGNLLSDLQGEAGDPARQMRADVNAGADAESRASAMARVANVAQVARVATVSSVAKVADVARPGESARAGNSGNDAISPLAVSGPAPMAGATDLAGSMRVVTPASAVNMADRISQLMDLQATQAAKPLSSVLLRMDNANGIEDQIRIDTRGTSVDARLGLGNAQQAAALTDRLGELREALERRGLTADGVRVQATTATRNTDTATFSRASAPSLELAAMRAAADAQSQGNTRDQSSRDQAQREAFARDHSRHTPRPSTDDARQRSRREQPEDRR